MASGGRDSANQDPNAYFTIHHDGQTLTHQEYINLMAFSHQNAARQAPLPIFSIRHCGDLLSHEEYIKMMNEAHRENTAREKEKILTHREYIDLIQKHIYDQMPAHQLGAPSATSAVLPRLDKEITLEDGSIFDTELGTVRAPTTGADNHEEDSGPDVVVEDSDHNDSSFSVDNLLLTGAAALENTDQFSPIASLAETTLIARNTPTPTQTAGNRTSTPTAVDVPLPESENEDTGHNPDRPGDADNNNLPSHADGNFLQAPIDGVNHIIRNRVDAPLVKRIIIAILYNGSAKHIIPTIRRAEEYIELFFLIPSGVSKPLTTGFYVNLHSTDDRALSIARTCYLLPRDDAYRNILPWLATLPNILNEAVNGITTPTAMALSDEDLARFAAHHAEEFYEAAIADGEKPDLCEIVTKHLTQVYPLIYKEGDTDQAVPLFKIVYLGRDHIPETYQTEMILQNVPEIVICNKVQLHPPYIIPNLKTFQTPNHRGYLNEIKLRISTAFATTGKPLSMIANAFRQGQFLTYLGRNPAHVDHHDPDAQITHQDIDLAPWKENDVYAESIRRHGVLWETTLRQLTNISTSLELTWPDLDTLGSSNRIYETVHKKTPFLIREWDPASLICDINRTHEGRLTPRVLCLAPEDQRLPQMDGISMDWNANFTIGVHKEMTWPGWTHEIRRTGQYIKRLSPGESRHHPIRVLRAGHTNWDLLIAHRDSVPFNFNKLSLHTGHIGYRPGQAVCDPNDIEGYEYMAEADRFIAAGPPNTIPQVQVLPGEKMMLKRCGLCFWIYGRTIMCIPCGHTFCSLCLGLTSLVTVDKMVCLYCWRIPEKVRGKPPNSLKHPPTPTSLPKPFSLIVSWDHQPGEMRLHLPGQEPVMHKTLAAHYDYRFKVIITPTTCHRHTPLLTHTAGVLEEETHVHQHGELGHRTEVLPHQGQEQRLHRR